MTTESKSPEAPAAPKKTPIYLSAPAFLLALSIPLAVLGFDVWRVIFNPPLIKALLTDEVVNSDLVPAGLEWFSENRANQRVDSGESLSGVDEPDIVLLLSYVNADGWRAIKKEVLADDFLIHLVSVTVDGTYAWVDSDERVPQITWDMRPFKAAVTGQPGENAITIAYESLPPCTDEEIADFLARLGAAPTGVEVLYNLCEFPDPWHDDQFEDYLHALVDVNQNIPDQLDLTDTLSQTADRGGVGPEALKTQLRAIRALGLWAWVVPVVCLLLIVALVVRSLPALSRWVGIPFLIGGLMAFVVALALSASLTGLLSTGLLSETPPLLQQETRRVIGRLAGEIFNPMMIQSAVILAAGLGMIIWDVIKTRQAKAASAAKPTPAPGN